MYLALLKAYRNERTEYLMQLKNNLNEFVQHGLNTDESYTTEPKKSTLSLDPTVAEVDTNYTCVVSNFLGEANHSFRVQLAPETSAPAQNNLWLTLTGIALVAAILLLLFIFSFYQLVRRECLEFCKNF